MRERSKKAARTRREKENHEFTELAKLLPLPGNVTSQLDKATVVKLTTAYLKLRELFPYGLGAPWGSAAPEELLKDLASFLLQALEGFLFIVGPNAKIIYISEGVSFYLGLSQVEMMGNNINEYIHVCDQGELEALLNHEEILRVDSRLYEEVEIARSFSLRMKCVLTKRSAGLVTDNYKLISCRGYLKLRPVRLGAEGVSDPLDVRYNVAGLVAVGNALHPTSILELKMYSHTFMFRAELDLKFLHLDPRAQDSIGYEPNQLLYKSFYKFVHVCDCFKIREDHLTLIAKGQAVTSYYRFLTLSGGWIWMQTSFILLLNSKSRQTFVLAINHVISDCEHDYYIIAEEQAANGELNFCNKDFPELEKLPVCSKDMPKKKRKKTKSTSISSPDCNSLSQHSILNSGFQNSDASLHFAQDSRLFTYSLPGSESNDFTLNMKNHSANSNELSVNPIQLIINDQPLNVPIQWDLSNRFHPVNFDQCANKTKSLMVNFRSQIHGQSANMTDSPASHHHSMTYPPLVCMEEKSTNYFQTFTNCQLSNGGKLATNNFLPATCIHSENTSRSFAYNLQSIARNNSSHLYDSSAKGLKTNWIANKHITNSCLPEDTNRTSFHLNELSSTSAPTVSHKIHNSFLTTMYPPFSPPIGISASVSSENPEQNSNQVSYAETLESSGAFDSTSTESCGINICNVDESNKRTQNADSYKLITRNSFSLASNFDTFAFSYPQQNLNGDTKIDSNIFERKSSAVQELNNLTENFKNKENFGSVFDHCKMSVEVEKHYFSDTSNLETEPHTPHNNQPHLIKTETSNKNRTTDMCIEDSLPKNIAFDSLDTNILQTYSSNISSEEIPKNWLNSDNLNNTCFHTEPLEIKSEGASSVISSNGQSTFSTKRDLSLSSDGCNEESAPSLFNLDNHTSGYSEQSYNENSYFDVQSRTSITNNSDLPFGLSFFTNSSSTPLYTVL